MSLNLPTPTLCFSYTGMERIRREEEPGSPGLSLPVSAFMVSHTTTIVCSQARQGRQRPRC